MKIALYSIFPLAWQRPAQTHILWRYSFLVSGVFKQLMAFHANWKWTDLCRVYSF